MRVSPEDIIKFNDLYLELKTYAGVARETGFSASTVKKYIIKDYVPAEKIETQKFSGDLPEFVPEIFRKQDWVSFLDMTKEEYEEIKELWKEMSL
jgi:hypothetical protein|nr:MAG TPA: KorB domain [Caudoviricetes sp.]